MAKKLSKRKRMELKQKEEQKQQRLEREEIKAKIAEEIEAVKAEEISKEEDEFFEFVKHRTNGFQYLLNEYYGLVEKSCGRRGDFDQPLNGGKEIAFYFRLREFQSELNSEKNFFTEKDVLKDYLKKNLTSGKKDAKTKTYERIVKCRLQVIESLGD